MSFLSVEAVRHRLGGREVLAGVDLAIPAGAILALLGQSGSGKTTLLRLVAGFEPADSGSIALGGRVLERTGLHVPAEHRHIGYVPQEGTLFPHLTVAENIGFGLTRAERRSGRVAEMLALTGMVGLEARTPRELSGGQQQRTALARALAPRPALVLLDEPFNALDMQLRRSVCDDVVGVLRRQGATAILVTHDPQEAIAQADLIAVMQGGRIVQCADPETVYRRPSDAGVARLTGSVIELDGVLADDRVDTALGVLQARGGAAPGRVTGPVMVLLRPEQVVADAGGIEAEVVSRRFRGDHQAVTIKAGSAIFEIRMAASEAACGGVRVAVRGPVLSIAPG